MQLRLQPLLAGYVNINKMEINFNLRPDLLVVDTKDVLNFNGQPRVRFGIVFKEQDYIADLSPDDELSGTSVIEQVGPQIYFNELNDLLKTTYRSQMQDWYTQHTSQ